MPPGSHRSPLDNVRIDIVLCEKSDCFQTPCPNSLNKMSNPYDIAGSGSLKTSLYGPSVMTRALEQDARERGNERLTWATKQTQTAHPRVSCAWAAADLFANSCPGL